MRIKRHDREHVLSNKQRMYFFFLMIELKIKRFGLKIGKKKKHDKLTTRC